jgi:hypothetical protein
MVQLPGQFRSSGVPQSLPMRVASWRNVLQRPAGLVEVWEHGGEIMQESGSKDRLRPREWKSAPGGQTA